MTDALPALFLAKLNDRVDRLERLLDLNPPDKVAWHPPQGGQQLPSSGKRADL